MIYRRYWSDMGIEQSINRDCGPIGGLTAIKTNKAAADRWHLTAHLKVNVASVFFTMLGLDDENQSSAHKESTMRRTENDKKFMRNMISVIEEIMFNPFQIESEWTAEEPKPLYPGG